MIFVFVAIVLLLLGLMIYDDYINF